MSSLINYLLSKLDIKVRLTLPEIVIDMIHTKGKFKPGEAYVAFS